MEAQLKDIFDSVHREKPESSRSVGLLWVYHCPLLKKWQDSKEAYFVALRRKVEMIKDAEDAYGEVESPDSIN